nr:zinc finger, CCHC-type [Tanacetum cinerariifolium]
MAVAAMKHMTSNFAKLDKFKGVDFRRWQKKMHCLLSSMSVVYVLTTHISDDGGDDPTMKQVRKRAKLVLEQYNELLEILGRFTQHKMKMDEAIKVSCVIDKLPHSWKDFKHTLKYLKEELTLVELGNHLRIEESLMVQDSDKPKGNNVSGPSGVNMVEHNNSSRYNENKGKCKHHDNTRVDPNKKAKPTCWKCGKTGHIKRDCKGVNVGNKAIGSGTKGLVDGSSNSMKAFMSTSKLNDSILWHARLGHVHFKRMQDMSKDGIELRVQGEAMLTACYLLNRVPNKRNMITLYEFWTKRKPNLNYLRVEVVVSINSIIKSMDAIFDEYRFSSVPRPSQRSLKDGTKDIGGSVVPEEVTGKDDPKTFDEAMKSQDVAFWKEAINDEMDCIMGNNTWVLADLPPGCEPLGCKRIFKRKLKVDGTIKKFKARLMDVKITFLNSELDEEVYMNQPQGFIMPGNENKVCKMIKSLYGLKQAPKQWHQKFNEVVLSNGYLLNQADKCIYSKFDESGKRVIICLYVDDMLIFGTDQVHVDLTKEFLSSRFSLKDMGEADVILATGKEVEWLKNLLLEIPLWSKSIAPIFIHCDSAATLEKAYSQMYNGKSRQLGVRHNMIRELITNEVNVESFKELWDSLKAKYMAEDALSKKFLVSNFRNYKMTDSRPVLELYNELLRILGRFTQHKMNMDEAIMEELTLVDLGSHLRIEESLRVQDSDKPKENNVAGPSVINMVEHNNSSRYNDNKGKRKHHDNTRVDPNKKAKPTCWKCGKTGHIKRDCKGVNVGNKTNGSSTKGSMDGSSNSLKGHNMFNKSLQIYYFTYVYEAYFVQDDDVAWWVDSGETVHKNKKDEDNAVIRNKTRLVAKGYRQEEGIDFEESFPSATRLDVGFSLPVLDWFVDSDHPEKVYRLFTIRNEEQILVVYFNEEVYVNQKSDKLIGWPSKKHDCTAMSTLDSKYVALSASCAQVIWMKTQLKDYVFDYNKIPLYCDSQSAIAIATEYKLADIFMKALLKERFEYLVGRLCMRCLTPAELEVLANETA